MEKFRINYQIKASQIRLIDEQGKQIGIFDFEKALEIAKDKGLDLVEVFPKANPPVCRLTDYGKYRYKQKKIEQKQKINQRKNSIIKGIRLSLNISEHDQKFKAKQIRKFLEKKYRVKIELILRGREAAHLDLAKEKISNFIKTLEEEVKIEMPAKKLGRKLVTIIS